MLCMCGMCGIWGMCILVVMALVSFRMVPHRGVLGLLLVDACVAVMYGVGGEHKESVRTGSSINK